MTVIPINTKSRDYEVRIGAGLLDTLGDAVRSCTKARRCVLVAGENVSSLYGERAAESLRRAGLEVHAVTFPSGEETKCLRYYGELLEFMASHKLTRSDCAVALGGGVTGDLTGFAAATYQRGIDYIQVPTTLLAAVDSSVGGKTAIDLPEGKNQVGAFWQPSFVCADTDVLSTLPEREWRCGCGEIAKSAVIDSDDFFFWLSEHAGELAERDPEVTAEAIARCVVFKADVVAQDKTESSGVRECLNYGHTLAHAIESCAGYGAFSHGHAVSQGMRFAARLAQGECDASAEFVAAQNELLDALGLEPIDTAAFATPEELLAAMKRDKKVRCGALRFVLARDVAQWESATISDETVLSYL